ncbi:MAG TPA: hypothetical protein DCQ98_11025 [Planctomycetaceae bacterium]|nr:hypothetical protein [Planctomycetaceae bacterium]
MPERPGATPMNDSANLPHKPAPIGRGSAGCCLIGRWHRECPVFIRSSTLDAILDFSAQDLRCERGGFLLGGAYRDTVPYVEIRHFAPARQTVGAAASMRFTHETWSGLRRDLEQSFPGESVVGWHHTHPDLGVFLSSYDRFIHRNFFSQPWQAALVVDPCRCELGLFQWIDGKLIDVGFALIDDPRQRRVG